MASVEAIINDVYTNPDSVACFSGINQVYKEARKKNKKICMKDVENYLAKQDAYTLHRPVRRKFKRNVTKTTGIDVDWQADLADMQKLKKENGGNTFILVVIDVLSRFVFVEPVKNKKAETIGKAFEKIMKRTGRKCWILTTDRGKEFEGHEFQVVVKRHEILHHYATSPDVKCAIVERYIRTLKSKIWRYFTKSRTVNYVKVLQKLATSTNNTVHRTIGCAPAHVNKNNQKEIWQRLYGKPEITKRALYKAGDHVRITKEKGKLSKGYQPNYTNEVFVVQKQLKHRHPATYKLTDLTGETLIGIFYDPELVRVATLSKLGEKVEEITKSELRRKQLWHLSKVNTQTKWIKDSELVLT